MSNSEETKPLLCPCSSGEPSMSESPLSMEYLPVSSSEEKEDFRRIQTFIELDDSKGLDLYLIENDVDVESCVMLVIENDKRECMDVLIKHSLPIIDLLYEVGANNQSRTLDYLLETHPEYNYDFVFTGAVRNGHIELARCISGLCTFKEPQNPIEACIAVGSISMVKVVERRTISKEEVPESLLISSSHHGYIDGVQYAISIGAQKLGLAMYTACMNKKPHIVSYLSNINKDAANSAMYIAVNRGHPEVVSYYVKPYTN